MKLWLAGILIFALGGCFLLIKPVGATIGITPSDSFVGDGTLDGGTISVVSVNIIGNSYPDVYYLKAYFYPEANSGARFGYNFNPDINKWVSTWSGNDQQRQITLDESGNWSGDVQVKTETDADRAGYTGPGNYMLKVKITSTTNSSRTYDTKVQVVIVAGQNSQDTGGNGDETDEEASDTVYSDKIIINELLPNPMESDDFEWIELKNIGDAAMDLVGWKIADASKSYVIKSDDFQSTIISAGGFFILDKEITGIALNNSGGETVSLYNQDDKLISQTSYNETAQDDQSWARDENGNYSWTTSLTKGDENIFSAPIVEQPNMGGVSNGGAASDQELEAVKEKNKYSDYQGKIIITEFLANPLGIDNNEWLEIYNTSTSSVDLAGWLLKDNSGEFKFSQINIKAKSYLLLDRKTTGLVLNNLGGDYLELIDQGNKLVDKVSYKNKVAAAESYNWCANQGKWMWILEISPGEENKCPAKNDQPVAYFEIEEQVLAKDKYVILDASESYDQDGQIVKYSWEFSQPVQIFGAKNNIWEFTEARVEIKFSKTGEQKIILKVVDNLGGEDEYSLPVEIGGLEEKTEIEASKIYINKFLPNPTGADSENEWIELCNSGKNDVDLTGFSLDDSAVGSKPYQLDDYSLAAESCIFITSAESHIALNNNSDSVRFLDINGEVVDQVDYSGGGEGLVYGKIDNTWQWIGESADSTVEQASEIYYGINDLGELRDLKAGSKVSVRGWVAVEPGLFGKTIFYIIDGSSGVQIYSYKKDFPELALGDFITVNGELSDNQGETRVKTKTKADIVKIKEDKLPAPLAIQLEDIGEDIEGALVKIAGDLTEIKGSSWWLDDQTEEVKIYIKQNTGISGNNFNVGDKLEVSGIISEIHGEYRVLPRFPADVKLAGRIASGATTNQEQPTSNQGNDLIKYLFVAAVGIIIILVSIIIRFKKV